MKQREKQFKHDNRKPLSEKVQELHTPETDELLNKVKSGNIINPNIHKINRPWLKRGLVGAMLAVAVLLGSVSVYNYYQNNETGVRVEYMKSTKTPDLPFLTVLNKFRLGRHRAVLFNYLGDNGLTFVLYDLDAKKVLMEDVVNEDVAEANSVMALAQLMPDVLKRNSNIKAIKQTTTGFNIDKVSYNIKMDGTNIRTVNDKSFKNHNVYFVAKSFTDLIKRNNLNVAKFKIQAVGDNAKTKTYDIVVSDSKGGKILFQMTRADKNDKNYGKISMNYYKAK